MKKRSDTDPDWESQRMKIIGLGESSIRKSYYPELQQRIEELERKNKELSAAYEEQARTEEELRQQFEETSYKEQELRRSEERFRNLIDASPVPIILAKDGRFVYVNRQFCQMSGYDSTADIVGRDLLDFIAPEHRERIAGNIRARKLGEPADVRYESVGLRKDGSRCPYEISVAVIGLSDGPVTMAFITDITERKAAEEALAKSGARLKRAEQIAGIGHWEFYMDSGIVRASDGARSIYGLSGEQRSIPDVQKIALPAYRPILDEALRALIREGRPYDVEFRIRRSTDNAVRDIHSLAEYDPLVRIVFGVIQDVTLQKQAEATLRESENKYRSIVETTPDLIWEIDAGGRFTFLSPKILDLLGYRADDLLGKTFFSLLPADQVLFAKEAFEKQVSGAQGLVTLEIVAQHADGHRMEMEIRSAAATDESGRLRGFRGITRDITESRRAAFSLDQARKKLNLLNTVTFQDIQNAAFSLSAYHILIDKEQKEPANRSFLEKESALIRKIIASLDFAKNFQDLGIKPPRWQDANQTFLFAISHLDFLHISHDFHLGDLEIYADPLLETAFSSLMENVIRHGKTATAVRAWYEARPDGLVLFVEDNGIGIPREEKHMIFDRSYGKDTGLGLFLVREILSITGMTIRETGDSGKGARFEIHVPPEGFRFKPVK